MSDVPSLKEIEERVQQLPFLPTVLTELINLDKNSPLYFEQVVALARKDPSLSTLILKIANSAASASKTPIDNLQLAMSRIGTESISGYIATLGVTRVFVPTADEHKLLWKHAIETAIYAERVALYMPTLSVNPEMAYLCGLLHDIGRFVMFDTAPEALAHTPSTSWASPQELPKVERSIVGYDHSMVGLIACKHWQLPKQICNLVRAHHAYSAFRNDDLPIGFRHLVFVIQFADFISIMLTKNPEWLNESEKQLQAHIKQYCVHDAWGDIELPLEKLSRDLPLLHQTAQEWSRSIGCG